MKVYFLLKETVTLRTLDKTDVVLYPGCYYVSSVDWLRVLIERMSFKTEDIECVGAIKEQKKCS